MRVIKETRTIKLPDDSTYRFFIQIWYSMVHRNSLDSHRIRCMNSFNILRELNDLIAKQNLLNIKDDIKRVSEETINILERDKIIHRYFSHNFQRVKPLLQDVIKKEISKGMKKERSSTLLAYYLKDFIIDLKERYKTSILSELEKAVFESKSEEDIFG